MTDALTATVTSSSAGNTPSPVEPPATNTQKAISTDRSSNGIGNLSQAANISQRTSTVQNRSDSVNLSQQSVQASRNNGGQQAPLPRDQTLTVTSTIGKFSRGTYTSEEAAEVYRSISRFL